MDNLQEQKGQPSSEQILKALEKSGYLFENKIARKAEALGFHVESSWAFKDPDEGISREIDIRAIKRVDHDDLNKIQVFTELLIECKSSDSPIVFLKTAKNQREKNNPRPLEYVFPYRKYMKRLTPTSYQEVGGFERFGLVKNHYYYSEDKKATQFAKIVRKSSEWHANHDGIYDSLILPQVKGVQSQIDACPKLMHATDWANISLFFSAVVLRDHLFSIDLESADMSPVPEGRVSFVRHIRSGTLDGYYLTDFVTEAYFDTYIGEISNFVNQLATIDKAQFRLKEYSE